MKTSIKPLARPLSCLILLGTVGLAGCAPKVQLVAPVDPIQINLNIKIDQEVRVRLDDDVNELITENPDLF